MIFTPLSTRLLPGTGYGIKQQDINSEGCLGTVLLLHNELENARSLNDKEIEALAKKINGIVCHFLKKIDNEFLRQNVGEETLYLSYLMAKTVKPASDANKKIWQNLTSKVQKFFNELTPFVLPPLDTNSQTMFLCSSSRIKNVGENPIYFGDYSLFKARYKQEAGGFLFFQLPDCPEVILCGTSQSTSRTAYYKNYVSEMPKEIQQVFDVDGVNEQISISRFKNISNILLPQQVHQKVVLKMEYLNMLLDVLGVPIDRSIAVAKRGEWVITADKPIKSLYQADFSSDKNSAGLEQTAFVEGIRKYLELEMRYG